MCISVTVHRGVQVVLHPVMAFQGRGGGRGEDLSGISELINALLNNKIHFNRAQFG